MTRARGWVWNHFVSESSGSRNGTCTFCGITYKGGKTNRMLLHLARACDQISEEVKREALSRLPATEILPPRATATVNVSGQSDTSSIMNRGVVGGGPLFSSRRQRDDDFDSFDEEEMENPLGMLQRPHGQRSLGVHGGRAQVLSSSDKKKLDGLFASAVYASGLPLSTFCSEEWKELYKAMCPAYDMPSRYILSNRLLDEECSRIETIVGHFLKTSPAGSFTITCDGWTNIKKTPLSIL